MNAFYTDEVHIQILISLLKEHGIRRVIASPGTTNLTFVVSIQKDPYFLVYSSVDERSAAYLACGMAAESGEPVVLSCTGATASRNYVPGLTEAYYRKLPVLALTSTQHVGRVGHNMPQVIDRSAQMKDIVNMSINVQSIHTAEDRWSTVASINEALLELTHRGSGPVHINMVTTYSKIYNVKELPAVRVIRRIGCSDGRPPITQGRVGIFVGAHLRWSQRLTKAVDRFCAEHNGVVFCDQTSNYQGKFAVYPSLVCSQAQYKSPCRKVDLLIHIGDISGADMWMDAAAVWRVNPDGKVRDTFKKLGYVFEMGETDFFEGYVTDPGRDSSTNTFYEEWKEECRQVSARIPELPFSNVWIAKNTIDKFPGGSTVYYAILNTLRSWNYFEAPKGVTGYSNTGGFGIDGGISSLIGASFVDPARLYFCITGDLAFFYDMNVLGNRHIGNNVRLMLINNGHGTEFTNYNHPGAMFGEEAESYIAAGGHFGNKSDKLVRHYAEDLGFEYLTASNKKEFENNIGRFLSGQPRDRSMIFEVFTDGSSESEALKQMHNLVSSAKGSTKQFVRKMLGEQGVRSVKKLMGKGE